MKKSVAKVVLPYVPSSMVEPCELASNIKSIEASMVKLQALRKAHDGVVPKREATSSHGVLRVSKPSDICQGEHIMLHKSPKSSLTLKGMGSIYDSLKATTETLKSSLRDYHRKNQEEGERKYKKKLLKSEMDRKWNEYLDSHEPKSMENHSYKKDMESPAPLLLLDDDPTDTNLVQVDGTKEEILKSEMQSNAYVCLVSLESKTKDVQGNNVGDVPTYPKEEESAPTLSTQVLVEGKEQEAELSICSSTYLSPLELSINKKLQQPPNSKMDQFLSPFRSEKCWNSCKGEARGATYFFSCSRVQNLTFCVNYCPHFKDNNLEGITCTLPTPHYHFYMLLRLQVSLVHLGANSYILRMENGDMRCSMYKLSWVDKVINFQKFIGLKYLSWVLFMLLSRISNAEIFIPIFSRWELFVDIEMEQFRPYCSVLKFQFSWVNVAQIGCENWMELCRTSTANYLHDVERVLVHLVIFIVRLIQQNSSSPFIAFSSSTSCVISPYSLSYYLLLILASDNSIVKLGVKPPWPLEEEYMNPYGREMGVNLSGGSELFISIESLVLSLVYSSKTKRGLNCSRDVIHLASDQGGTSGWDKQAEFGNGALHLLPFTILVYDPGGGHVSPSFKVVLELSK